jgi:hypothetical protein
VARMSEGRSVNKMLLVKPEVQRALWRPRPRWEYNIKIYLQEVGTVCVD